MERPKISKRQQAIYDFICIYTRDHGYPPSVREIGNAVGLASPSTVHTHLKTLEDKGYIRRDSKKPRTIEVVEDKSHASDTDDEVIGITQSLVNVIQNASKNTMSLPLVGRVAAGVPVLAEQNVEDVLTLPTSLVGDSSSYILRVHGNSMINVGIFDGDYIVVREQQEARDGDIVVALIDDSATVKTFYREREFIRLQPENDAMEPIYVLNPKILGKVSALIRRF